MDATLKTVSALLSYPTRELQCAMDELAAVFAADKRLAAGQQQELLTLCAEIAENDLIEVQSRYVDLFDRTRSLSLNLFEHVHGESRDRGQAMVSLLERYRLAGFDISARQLPDYLPLFLEFLSLQPEKPAQELLAEPAHILAAMGERLKRRKSAYAAAFEALMTLSTAQLDRGVLIKLGNEEIEDPNNLAALDRVWEETEVRFGPDAAGSGDCPHAARVLQEMRAPEPTKDQGAAP